MSTQTPVIGVWSQPIRLHATWKARGINTLCRFEADGGAATLDQFLASAKTNGLAVWLQSSVIRPQDYANPIVVGIMLDPDEPDGIGAATPAVMLPKYNAVRAALATAGRNLPILVDFDGNKIPFNPPATYTAYAAACDVMAEDVYPFNYAVTGGISAITNRIQTLQKAGNKPVIAIIECSDQDINKQPWTAANDATGTPLGPKMRGPTAAEFAQEVSTAMTAGAAGVIYFPDQIGLGWEGFDGTPADVAAEMTTVNAALAKTTVPSFSLPPLPAAPVVVAPPAPKPLAVTVGVAGYVSQTVTLQPA